MRIDTGAHFCFQQHELLEPGMAVNLEQFLASEASRAPHLLLLGNPVSHSLSPFMHNLAVEHYGLDLRYHAVRLEEGEVGRLASHLNHPNFRGGNVTIPHKERLVAVVDRLEPSAEAIGAINTIVKTGKSITGANTDVFGFTKPLDAYRDLLRAGRAVIFGTGGAAKAIVYALDRMGMQELILVSRNPGRADPGDFAADVRVEGYGAWTAFAEGASLIVNATPLGMEHRKEESPVRPSEKEYLSGKVCYDIVYRPVKTTFLTLAEEAGAEMVPGLNMLIYQASRSFEQWTGNPFPVERIREAVYEKI